MTIEQLDQLEAEIEAEIEEKKRNGTYKEPVLETNWQIKGYGWFDSKGCPLHFPNEQTSRTKAGFSISLGNISEELAKEKMEKYKTFEHVLPETVHLFKSAQWKND